MTRTHLSALYLSRLPVTPNNKNQLAAKLTDFDNAIDSLEDSLGVTSLTAVGDGVTDDTAAIQSALDTIDAAGGGVLFIPRGTYRITNSVHIGSNTTVRGAGIGATVLRGAAGSYAGQTVNGTTLAATLGAVAESRITVEHLTIDHQTNDTIANGVAFIAGTSFTGTVCTDCTVRHCEILSHPDHEYALWSMRGQQIRFVNNRVDGGCTSHGVEVLDGEGISLFGSEDVLIANNIVTRCENDGINVAASVDYPDASNTNVTIIGNVISGCRDGINLGTSYDATNGAQNLINILVSGNVVNDSYAYGIYAWTPVAGSAFRNVLIENNAVNGGPYGIYVQGIDTDTSHRGVAVRGNTLYGQTTSVAALVVNLFHGCDVEGNTVDTVASGEGIRVDRSDHVRVIGNRIARAGLNGLRVSSADYCIAQGNEIIDCAPSTYAAYFTSAVMNVAIGNTIRSSSAFAHIYMSGTSGIVADNVTPIGIAVPWVNACTSANFGTSAAMTATATTLDVTAGLAKSGSDFKVRQVAGTPILFKVGYITGGFRITTATQAVGDETFAWEIR
jgi:parallel beta-helix repeat protein